MRTFVSKKMVLWGGLLSGFALCAGCGGEAKLKVIPVKGKLTVDGKPYGPASLVLIPTGTTSTQQATASADDQGNLTFRTYEHGDGVPLGDYHVMVISGGSSLPAIYSDEAKSPATVKVDPQSKDLKIDLLSSAGPLPTTVPGGIAGGADPSMSADPAVLKKKQEASGGK